MKVNVSHEKEELNVETLPLYDYISMPKVDKLDLIDKLKTKRSWCNIPKIKAKSFFLIIL